MPLTEAQIAFENGWVERWKTLTLGQDGEAWSMLYAGALQEDTNSLLPTKLNAILYPSLIADDATFRSTSGPLLKGRPTILKYREHLFTVFEDFDAG